MLNLYILHPQQNSVKFLYPYLSTLSDPNFLEQY